MPGQVVRVINHGDSDFNDMYNNQPYVIPAGTETIIEYDAVCLWLGHPEANNFDPRNRVRVAEFQRLRTRYGVDARALEMSTQGIPVDIDALFNSMRPKLDCFKLDGSPLITVADDPEGNMLSPVDESRLSSEAMLQQRMQILEQELQNIRAQQAQQQRREQALNDATPVATDDLDEDSPLRVGGDGIPGTIVTTPDPALADPASIAPRPTARTEPGEDSPTRVRVSG